jgi:phosphoglycolate phosphatase-like HAD superfamily hydrolase
MLPRRLILFDIDGTLLHAGGVGRRAFSKAFFDLFQVEDAYEGTVARGRTDPGLIQEISERTLGRSLSLSEYQMLRKSYVEAFRMEIVHADKYRLMPGATALLRELNNSQKCALGIETGNFQETAQIKLQHGNLHHFFSSGGFGCDAGGYGCESQNRAQIVQTAIARAEESHGDSFDRVLVIGDAPQDIEAAKANDAAALLVLTGGVTTDDPSTAKADLVVDNLEDLTLIVEFLMTY